MTPRVSLSREKLEEYGDQEGWFLEAEIESDDQRGIWHEVRWSCGPRLWIHYLEDPISSVAYLIVTGNDPQLIKSMSRTIEHDLDTWPIAELIGIVDSASDPHVLARAVVRLGVAAPHSFDKRVFDRIRNALNHSESGVRHAALWALSFSPWPRYRPLISGIARSDPEPWLREAAQAVLDGFDAAEVGEE
jgi:translation initiation factor 2 alpha subunit (eIF-2alpha)